MSTGRAGAGEQARALVDRPRLDIRPRITPSLDVDVRLPARLAALRSTTAALWSALFLALLLWLASLRLRLTYDEGVYAETARLIARGRPLVSDVFSSQPPLWPFLLVPGWALGGVTTTRVWIMLWGLAGLVAVYRIARCYLPRSLSLGVVVLVAACPGYASMATAVEGETPAIALALWSLSVALAPSARVLRSFAAGVLLGVGLMVKLLVAPMLVVVLVAVLATSDARSRRLRLRKAAAYVVGVAIVVAFAGLWWNGGQLWDQVIGFHVSAQGGLTGLRDNVHQALQSEFTVIFLAAGAVAAGCLVTRRRPRPLLPLLWLIAVSVFLAVHVPLFAHHLVLAVPPAALLLVMALQEVPDVRWRSGGLAVAVAVTVVVLAVDVVASPSRETAARNPAVAALARLPDRSVVVTDDQTLAVEADRAVPGPLVDTSNVRISTGALSSATVCREVARADAVLLTTGGRFGALPEVRTCTEAHMHVTWRGSAGALYER